MAATADILLVAINARYSHCSHAGRLLLANLGSLGARATLLEYDLETLPLQLASDILARQPRIVGCIVYLWNRTLVGDTLRLLRLLAPELRTIIGGPELVADDAAAWQGLADAIAIGEGEALFRNWCQAQLAATTATPPATGPLLLQAATPPDTATLLPPYHLYSDHDLQRRVVYVESARGCPHHCIYCTSCNSGWRAFPLPPLLREFDQLRQRGLRNFRFLDRTFNVDEPHACRLLDYFLDHRDEGLRLHLELSPVAYGPGLRQRLAAFPPGMLHLEVGLQTLDSATARRIGRHEERSTALTALRFLQQECSADLHVDLIYGLPGEDLTTFTAGFDQLVLLGLPTIQVNRLKVLPGTPLSRLPAIKGSYNPAPPYEVLFSDVLTHYELTRLQRFAHAWDRLNNRNRFSHSLPLLWQTPSASPFAAVDAIAQEVYRTCGRVHAIGADLWGATLAAYLKGHSTLPPHLIELALKRDNIAI